MGATRWTDICSGSGWKGGRRRMWRGCERSIARSISPSPFENLDVHLGRGYSFALPHLVQKLVVRRRGGFCYELNLLLASALRGLGFEVDLLEGQMRRREGGFGPPYDHMTLRVRLDGRDWLADAGNGETFQQPLPWDGEVDAAGARRGLSSGAARGRGAGRRGGVRFGGDVAGGVPRG